MPGKPKQSAALRRLEADGGNVQPPRSFAGRAWRWRGPLAACNGLRVSYSSSALGCCEWGSQVSHTAMAMSSTGSTCGNFDPF